DWTGILNVDLVGTGLLGLCCLRAVLEQPFPLISDRQIDGIDGAASEDTAPIRQIVATVSLHHDDIEIAVSGVLDAGGRWSSGVPRRVIVVIDCNRLTRRGRGASLCGSRAGRRCGLGRRAGLSRSRGSGG